MKSKHKILQTRLYLITAIIFFTGLGSAILIYLTVNNGPDSRLSYETADGYVYQTRPEDSKMYLHDLELYGGKANVLADAFIRWFAGLWHGKSLALTITCITAILSFGFFFVARRLPSELGPDDCDEHSKTATD